MRAVVIAVSCLMSCLLAAPASAQPDDARGPEPLTVEGRYSLQRDGDGFVRLDTVTGTMSRCSPRAAGWACQAMPEERSALENEIARLQDQNADLRQQLAGGAPSRPGAGSEAPPHDNKPSHDNRQPRVDKAPDARLRLPTQEDVDRAAAFAGRVWRHLMDMLNDVQKDIREKI